MSARNPADDFCAALDDLRTAVPLVQCLTNAVVTNFTANVLLAIGAAPAMVDIPTEAELFARIASGTLVNLGTPHASQRAAMVEAATAAHAAGVPWVLDPVAVGFLPIRTALAADLLTQRPTAIRGNPSEIIALAGLGAGGRGVDSSDNPETALDAATLLARNYGSIVSVSGATDLVTDGTEVMRLSNGHPFLTRVTGGGCALGAVTAAFLGARAQQGAEPSDLLTAVAAATAIYTIAAEMAADTARGPGSFAMEFLDALSEIDSTVVRSRLVLG